MAGNRLSPVSIRFVGHRMDGEFPGETLGNAGSSAAERPEGYSRKAKMLSDKTRLRFFADTKPHLRNIRT